MPNNSTSVNTNTSQIPIAESEKKVAKVKAWSKAKTYFLLALLILGVITAFYLANLFKTMKNASMYKKAYDVVQEQYRFCDNPKYEGKDPSVIVHYCDEFKNRFNSVSRKQ